MLQVVVAHQGRCCILALQPEGTTTDTDGLFGCLRMDCWSARLTEAVNSVRAAVVLYLTTNSRSES